MARRQHTRTFGLKLTRAGTVYITTTLLLGFAAVNTGNNLLYLLVSALLGFMAVSGLLGRANLARLEVSCRLPEEIYAALPVTLEVELHNHRRRLPAFLVEVRIGSGHALLPAVPAGTTGRVRLGLRFPRRGEQGLPMLQLASGFPIRFFIRHIGLQPAERALVFPAPLPTPPQTTAPGHHADALLSGHQRSLGGDLRSIDDYRDGEPLRNIHWKLSARQPQLKVKQLAGPQGEPVIIDPRSFSGSLEERLGQACHLLQQLSRQNRPVGLQLPHRRIPPATGRRHRLLLLGELARL